MQAFLVFIRSDAISNDTIVTKLFATVHIISFAKICNSPYFSTLFRFGTTENCWSSGSDQFAAMMSGKIRLICPFLVILHIFNRYPISITHYGLVIWLWILVTLVTPIIIYSVFGCFLVLSNTCVDYKREIRILTVGIIYHLYWDEFYTVAIRNTCAYTLYIHYIYVYIHIRINKIL